MRWFDPLVPFVADLGAGDDRLPLERVMRRHLAAFNAVIATGRTWPQIAQALTKAGARHRRGQPMCAKQLRTVFRRLSMEQTPSPAARNEVLPPRPPVQDTGSNASATTVRSPPVQTQTGQTHQDVMNRLAEIRRARTALTREFDE